MTFTTNRGTHSDEVVQYIFPYAAPGPTTHVPAGQRYWMEKTVGGWFTARPGLRQLLIDIGIPPKHASAEATGATAPDQDRRSPLPAVLAVSAILALLAAIAATRARSRRRVADARA